MPQVADFSTIYDRNVKKKCVGGYKQVIYNMTARSVPLSGGKLCPKCFMIGVYMYMIHIPITRSRALDLSAGDQHLVGPSGVWPKQSTHSLCPRRLVKANCSAMLWGLAHH